MYFFAFFTSLISISGLVLIIVLIVRAFSNARKTRKEAYMAALEKGIYDPALLGPRKSGGRVGHGSLGWGLVLTALGIGLLISFNLADLPKESMIGGAIPLSLGLGLLVFFGIARATAPKVEKNGEPVKFDPVAAQPVGSERVEGNG